MRAQPDPAHRHAEIRHFVQSSEAVAYFIADRGKPRRRSDLLTLSFVAAVSMLVAKDPSKAREYTIKGKMVAVISDGSAVLGLGNIGALGALPVMEGKAALFKTFANVDAFPIVLDTQDTDRKSVV